MLTARALPLRGWGSTRMRITLNPRELATLYMALHVARAQYLQDAVVTKDTPRIAEQFRFQAHDCAQLTEKISVEEDGDPNDRPESTNRDPLLVHDDREPDYSGTPTCKHCKAFIAFDKIHGCWRHVASQKELCASGRTRTHPSVAIPAGTRCAHSACSQHYIETGECACIEGSLVLDKYSLLMQASVSRPKVTSVIQIDSDTPDMAVLKYDDHDGCREIELRWRETIRSWVEVSDL